MKHKTVDLPNTSLCLLFCKANVRKSIKHFKCSKQPSLIQLSISSSKQVYINGNSFRSTSSHNLRISPVMTSWIVEEPEFKPVIKCYINSYRYKQAYRIKKTMQLKIIWPSANLSWIVVTIDLLNKNFKTFPALEWSFMEVPFMTCQSRAVTPSIRIGDDFLAASSKTFIKPSSQSGKWWVITIITASSKQVRSQ